MNNKHAIWNFKLLNQTQILTQKYKWSVYVNKDQMSENAKHINLSLWQLIKPEETYILINSY